MRKLFILLISVVFTITIQGQLIANLQLPVIGLSTKSQLWSMVLVNTGNQVLQLKIGLVFTDETNNQTVMTASTSQFNLSPGTHALQMSDFMPITYNVVNSNYNVDNNPNGFLPVGHFNVCYQFDRFFSDAYENLTEECESVEIDPVGPPELVFPEDEAVIEIPRPVFNWLPPSPPNFFTNLSFDIRLVEVIGTQTPADAIQQNIALYAQQGLSALSVSYPGSLAALDTGKLYAWQVTANNNNSFIARTDVWTFSIGQFGTVGNNYNSNGAFARLKKEGTINYFLCTGIMKVEYENYLADDTVAVSVSDISNAQAQVSLDSSYLVLKPGQNMIALDLSDNNQFINNHVYQFEIVNSKNEKWIAKFHFRRED